MSDAAPQGHVRLVLILEPPFYLEIPMVIINTLCTKALKYLVYLGWCVLGVEGKLVEHPNGNPVSDLCGDLTDGGLYAYDIGAGVSLDLSQAVKLEVIKQRSTSSSATTESRDINFRQRLVERDVCCVWTGMPAEFTDAIHIIPFRSGSQWVQNIVENRPNYNENVDNLTDINDIRNGILASCIIHPAFDSRKLVVLKTPNHILDTTDIVQRTRRTFNLHDQVIYPSDMRYTLQWLTEEEPVVLQTIQNNTDATFKKDTEKPKPSELLLHYNYGVAAVKWWGHGTDVLQNSPDLVRPTVPALAPMGPTRTVNNRSSAIQKHDAARADSPQPVDSGMNEAPWDAEDLVLFLWGNSPASVARYRKKQEERTQNTEQWRQGVSSVFV